MAATKTQHLEELDAVWYTDSRYIPITFISTKFPQSWEEAEFFNQLLVVLKLQYHWVILILLMQKGIMSYLWYHFLFFFIEMIN